MDYISNLAGKVYEFNTCSEAWEGILQQYMNGELPFHWPAWDGDYAIIIRDPSADINFARAGITSLRWKRFLNDYVHPGVFAGFMAEAQNLKAAKELTYMPPQSGEHLAGNCLIGINIRRRQPRIAMYSRSSRWTPTGVLDLSFAGLISEALCSYWGVPQVPLVWHIGRLNMSPGHILIPAEYHGWELPERDDDQGSIANKLQDALERYNELIKTGTTYKTDRRICINLRKIRSGEGHKDFYPSFPPYYTKVDPESFSLTSLAKHYGIKPKDVKSFIRPFRAEIANNSNYTPLGHYSMVWPAGHPEVMFLDWCMVNKRAWSKVGDVFRALGVEDWGEVKVMYGEAYPEI